jgi:hypothetical protein
MMLISSGSRILNAVAYENSWMLGELQQIGWVEHAASVLPSTHA